jgi:hypothetical protein
MIEKIEAIRSLVGGSITQKYNGDVIYHDGQVAPTEAEIQTKIAELKAAEPMRLLRVERDRRIALTDWRFRSDLTPSQAWIDYCQALRDLPANSTPALDENGQLTGVNWPTPPEN